MCFSSFLIGHNRRGVAVNPPRPSSPSARSERIAPSHSLGIFRRRLPFPFADFSRYRLSRTQDRHRGCHQASEDDFQGTQRPHPRFQPVPAQGAYAPDLARVSSPRDPRESSRFPRSISTSGTASRGDFHAPRRRSAEPTRAIPAPTRLVSSRPSITRHSRLQRTRGRMDRRSPVRLLRSLEIGRPRLDLRILHLEINLLNLVTKRPPTRRVRGEPSRNSPSKKIRLHTFLKNSPTPNENDSRRATRFAWKTSSARNAKKPSVRKVPGVVPRRNLRLSSCTPFRT